MARNEDLYCMICAESPCVCTKARGASPQRARPKAMPEPVAPPEPEPVASPPVAARPSFVDRMRAQAHEKEQEDKRRRLEESMAPTRKAPSRFNEMTDEEAATLAAVRALSEAFEIHPDDLAPFQNRLAQPPSVEERAGAWRYRRGVPSSEGEDKAGGR